MGSFEGEFKMG